jgi:hypothetical protein
LKLEELHEEMVKNKSDFLTNIGTTEEEIQQVKYEIAGIKERMDKGQKEIIGIISQKVIEKIRTGNQFTLFSSGDKMGQTRNLQVITLISTKLNAKARVMLAQVIKTKTKS